MVVIYPFASMFNHSCDSNCEAIRDGRDLIIKTKRPINCNEELTISYIDTDRPVSARRDHLFRDYK